MKYRKPLFIFLGLLITIALVFVFLKFYPKKGAGISIQSNPAATVYIDGEESGRTPFERTAQPGELMIKLIPDSFEKPLAPYETKVLAYSGTKVQINRNFGETNDDSSGYVAYFEKIDNDETELVINGNTEGVEVKIDGQTMGYTPFSTKNLTEGKYRLTLDKSSYNSLEMDIGTKKGNKLNVTYNLSKQNNILNAEDVEKSETQEDEKDNIEEKNETVEILSTPTGFLRIRKLPSTSSEEIGRVIPGNNFELVEKSTDGKWYKIEYGEDNTGWVSAQYAKIVSGNDTKVTPTPTKKDTPIEKD